MTQPIKYILYLRKSTDDGKHQKLSLPAQDFETREYATTSNYPIFEVVTDSKTAKFPGRPGFNEMIERVRRGYGFPVGIIAWSVDRLSRNPSDDALLKNLLDSGELSDLQFRNYRFENNATGRFLLDIQFAEARYHISKHSEGLKRTMDEKLRRGQFPGRTPFGWRFNPRIRNIEPHPTQGQFILSLFREFATGNHSLRTATLWLDQENRKHCTGRSASVSSTQYMLRNVTYMGLIPWKRKTYEGAFKPIVSAALFNKVQSLLDQGRRPRKLRRKHNFPFCGVFRCSCGAMISAQYAKGGRYQYYRCSRKLLKSCNERYVRAENLYAQLLKTVKSLSLPPGCGDLFRSQLDHAMRENHKALQVRRTALVRDLDEVQDRLRKLLDLNLERMVDEDTFDQEHQKQITRKAEIRSQLRASDREATETWFELLRDVVETLNQATALTTESAHADMSKIIRKIGTNRRISNGSVHLELAPPYETVASRLAQIATGAADRKPVAVADFGSRSTWCAY